MNKLIKFTYSNGITKYFRSEDIKYITHNTVVFTNEASISDQSPNNVSEIVDQYNN